MMTAADARRRWFGALFLAIAGGMLIWGQTLLKSRLVGFCFLIYWLACFLFTGLAMAVALLDIWVMRQRIQRSQQDIWEEAMSEPQKSKQSSPPSSASTPIESQGSTVAKSVKKE